MPVIAWLTNQLARSAFSNAYSRIVEFIWSRRDSILPARTSTHFRELRSKLADMPFIYKDLEPGDLLNEYVAVELEALDLTSLATKPPNKFGIKREQRIKETRHALILGSAGIGKTTFLLHTVLEIIKGKGHSPQFYEGEFLIPFYVPLKAVDISHPFPIIRYVLTTNRLLQGASGLTTLLKLAQKRQCALFLDGYDEIPFPISNESEQNRVQIELGIMMQSRSSYEHLRDDLADYGKLYKLLGDCRIWLASRKEFFERNRIEIGGIKQGDGRAVATVVAVELRGIGKNRMKLVKLIFDKYKNRSPRYANLLSPEYFMQDIGRSGDPELIMLLTTRCS